MEVKSFKERPATKLTTYPYKGQPLNVKEVWIRWLSQAGPEGAPEYGLRYFTIGPGGEIPIHNHLYYQTMYVLQGSMLVVSHDPETDEPVEEKRVQADDFIFLPSMEPHSMRNLSDTEDANFLCCIANVFEG